MKSQTILISAFLSISLFSCGGGEEESESATDSNETTETTEETTESSEVDWKQLRDGTVMPDRAFSITGYIGAVKPGMETTEGELRVNIYQRRNQQEGFYLEAGIPVGDGVNQAAELPAEFVNDDLTIRAADDTYLAVGDYVKLEGVYAESFVYDFKFYNNISIIEPAEDPFNETSLYEAVELTDAIIDDTDPAKDMNYCYMDITITGQDAGSYSPRFYTLTVDQENNSYMETVKMPIGEENSQMTLPDPYSNGSVFTSLDFEGQEVTSDTEFRVYGTFVHKTGSRKGVFYVEETAKMK